MNILRYILLFFIGTILYPASAQITVAIADFENNSDTFYLDTWEKSIPEFMKSELSRSDKITVVERRQLESVLSEQALSMTGMVDSSTAQKVGNLLGAEYVISGSINQSGKWSRIDARIIRVSTGQVKSEKVQAPDDKHLTEMVDLLANNIIYMLAGDGNYQKKISLEKYPTGYFLAASAGLALGTLLVNNAYNDKLDEYHNATRLSEFDDTYSSANDLKKVTVVMASLTGAAIAGAVYCWINNLSPAEIIAQDLATKTVIIPNLVFDNEGNVYAAISVHF